MSAFIDLYPIPDGSEHTVIKVNYPIRIAALGSIGLGPGLYRIPGDLRMRLSQTLHDKTLLHKKIIHVEFVAATSAPANNQPDVVREPAAPTLTNTQPQIVLTEYINPQIDINRETVFVRRFDDPSSTMSSSVNVDTKPIDGQVHVVPTNINKQTAAQLTSADIANKTSDNNVDVQVKRKRFSKKQKSDTSVP